MEVQYINYIKVRPLCGKEKEGPGAQPAVLLPSPPPSILQQPMEHLWEPLGFRGVQLENHRFRIKGRGCGVSRPKFKN